MRFSIPDGYTIRYRHDSEPTPVLFDRALPDAGPAHLGLWTVQRRRTTAIINDQDGYTVATAVATCRPEDQFCKRIGREIARGRALKRLYTKIYRTPGGRVLSDRDFEHLADEAEQGYDVSHLEPGSTAALASGSIHKYQRPISPRHGLPPAIED